ncbi:HNH endonuclease, partial [Mycobacterium tuberculosis]|nr:HNH endonuclease [Mycobacterium tuberculosis]
TEQVEAFREQIKNKNYEVDDSYATAKTRGSAQRAFSEEVKKIYDFRCAITGIDTKDFLVAAHIVPWSQDKSIRLDPSNGICLSLI